MAFDMPQPVHTPRSERFRAAVLAGLAAPQKAVPPLFFYDDRGSELFESIKSSDDYYVTRAETAALLGAVGTLARIDAGALVELGAGTGRRLEILLRSLPGLRAFCPVDLSIVQLALSEGDAADSGRRIAIAPLLADFAEPFVLPPDVPGPRLAYFPGSSIGNFQPLGAQRLLSQLRASLGAGSQLLICVDLLKDARRLERAYDDRSGHTAAFNLNLLRRINRELDGAFALENFGHEARFNLEQGRI
ncbi:MAG: L-histidine N(alpha)-methyltransferase, partial [Pseudomonadota bacterium]